MFPMNFLFNHLYFIKIDNRIILSEIGSIDLFRSQLFYFIFLKKECSVEEGLFYISY
jgi:hypothetical protein